MLTGITTPHTNTGDVLGVSMLQPSPLRLKLVRGSVARPFFQNVIVPHTAETPYSLPPTLALQRATPLELVLTAHEGKPPGSRGVRVCICVGV